MEREQIIKALDSFHQRILDTDLAENIYEAEIMAIIDALSLIKELTQACAMLSESYDHLEKTKDELLAERSRLTEENEKLNEAFNEHLANVLNRIKEVRQETKADTVKKMQERLNDRIKDKLAYHGWYIKETIIPGITKEMLEGNNE